MSAIQNFSSLINLGRIDIRLMHLVWDLKRTRRTYLSYTTLYSLARNYQRIRRKTDKPLSVAEFGVGRGGSATLLAWMVNRDKGNLALFDVFGQIPPPTEQDGERAVNRYKFIVNDEQKDYYGNIGNLLELIQQDLSKVCDSRRIEFIQGKYEETLPGLVDERKFNLVHIDCDWYESSMAVYQYLKTRLKPGAVVQVDDYSNWEGSKRAYQEVEWLNTHSTWIVDGALVIDTSHPAK